VAEDKKAAAIDAIEDAIIGLASSSGAAEHTRQILDLAEARAWLVNPSEPHGGRAESAEH
jgi:hypothetical protein